jgi:hypothetical protein
MPQSNVASRHQLGLVKIWVSVDAAREASEQIGYRQLALSQAC